MSRGPLRRRLEAAWRVSEKHPRDAATIELARMYADQLDATEDLARVAQDIVEAWDGGDPIGRAHAAKLANALSSRQALADLGPKYLAALAALNLTTAARTAGAKTESGDGQPTPDEAALLALRGTARKRRAAALDAAAAPPDA